MNLHEYLERITKSSNLNITEADNLANLLLLDDDNTLLKSSILASLRTKGETSDEIAGFANALKSNCVTIEPTATDLIDNCGTGGDKLNTFNISTATSFVLAGGGLNVAKHGNRSVSSNCGSADILEELGVNISLNKSIVENIINEIGLCFIFAQNFHPKMKGIMPARKSLKIPTIFNLVGPISNPSKLTHQILGVYDEKYMEPMAKALLTLGIKRGFVVHGYNKMDELSLQGDNIIVEINSGIIKRSLLNPTDYGFKNYNNSLLVSNTKDENIRKFNYALSREETAEKEIVSLNAALGFLASGKVMNLNEGRDLAYEIIDSGQAMNKLHELITATNRRLS